MLIPRRRKKNMLTVDTIVFMPRAKNTTRSILHFIFKSVIHRRQLTQNWIGLNNMFDGRSTFYYLHVKQGAHQVYLVNSWWILKHTWQGFHQTRRRFLILDMTHFGLMSISQYLLLFGQEHSIHTQVYPSVISSLQEVDKDSFSKNSPHFGSFIFKFSSIKFLKPRFSFFYY